MAYLIPLICAYAIYYFTYRDKIRALRHKIENINSKLENMDKDDIIIGMVKDLKTDFVNMRSEVNKIRDDVSSLKTKAGVISFVSAGIVSGVMGMFFKFFM